MLTGAVGKLEIAGARWGSACYFPGANSS